MISNQLCPHENRDMREERQDMEVFNELACYQMEPLTLRFRDDMKEDSRPNVGYHVVGKPMNTDRGVQRKPITTI